MTNSLISDRLADVLTRIKRESTRVEAVVDIVDPNSFLEIGAGMLTRFQQYRLDVHLLRDPQLSSCRLYGTCRAGFELLKRGLPLEHLAYGPTIVLGNVAKIDEAEGGRRKDHLVVALTKANRLIVSYAAPNSGLLDPLLAEEGIVQIFEFHTPPAWDKDQTFRSACVLPRVAAGLVACHSDVLDHLEDVPLTEARERFSVAQADPGRAWWTDAFGDAPRYNIKTAYRRSDLMFADVPYGAKLEVRVGDHKPQEAVFARSVHSSGTKGGLALAHGSSGYQNGHGPIKFFDLMVWGGNAWIALGQPNPEELLSVRVLETAAA